MALGKLFDIQGEAIIPKPDCFVIQPLKALIDAYPKDYPRMLAYLHYMKSMRPEDNPYADVPVMERSEQIMYDLKLDFDEEDAIIIDALNCVEEKYYTTFYGVYRGMKTMLDKIGSKLFTEDIDFKQRDGNSNNIKAWIKDYEQLRSSLKLAFKDFEEEQGGMKVRGGGSLADDEDTDY